MAKGAMKIFLLATAITAASFWIPAAGQSGCTSALISLSPCLNYISGSSSTPSSSCCSQLASIVQSQPQCLCMVVNGGGSIVGISINKTQALALPSACKVQTPPVSACNAVTGGSSGSPPVAPQAAPSTPTAPSTPSTPSTPSAPSAPSTPTTTPEAPSSPTDTPSTLAPTGSSSGNGSKSTNGDSSDGRMNKSLMSIVFTALIFGSSLASFF
ncbi:hypothetical protein IEQ34_013360 [Dendrobium chrysotoxum]|uniref:Bifunctional inhibitor/plant lipid transfer protein/seed storage helical domain-containing protein n=1 Tax=Dendrobium chrysotoxum TaxID=161865 RepID=A0AAV7GRH7_DENCH|nr:hypothetical protein IEQ34_013360 [Dendrobium chrysotoxum]